MNSRLFIIDQLEKILNTFCELDNFSNCKFLEMCQLFQFKKLADFQIRKLCN